MVSPIDNHPLQWGLTFAAGHAELGLRAAVPAGPLTVEELTLAMPEAYSDAETPVERWQTRRGALERVRIVLTESSLAAWLRARQFESLGLLDLGVRIAAGRIWLAFSAQVGETVVDATARMTLAPAGGQAVRIVIEEVQLYGYVPIPAPLWGLAILHGALPKNGGSVAAQGGMVLRGCDELVGNVLAPALWQLLPRHGWRLPVYRPSRLAELAVREHAIDLTFSLQGEAGAAPRSDEPGTLCPRGEAALAAHALDEAIDAFRAAHAESHHPVLAARQLALLSASPSHWDEAVELALEELVRRPGDRSAVLALANIEAQRGDIESATARYLALGEQAAEEGALEDQLAAFGRAAQLLGDRELARDAERVTPLLERMVGLHPRRERCSDFIRASQRLAVRYAAEGRWEELSQLDQQAGDGMRGNARLAEALAARCEVLERKGDQPALIETLERLAGCVAGDPVACARALAAQGAARSRLGEFEAAADSYRRAVSIDGSNVSARQGLGDAAWQLRRWSEARAAWEPLFESQSELRIPLALRLGAAAERQGDVPGARYYHASALEQGAEGAEAIRAHEALIALALGHGDFEAAVEAQLLAADDVRTQEGDAVRAGRLVAAADILRRRVERPDEALWLYERALSMDPLNLKALDALEEMADGSAERLGQVLSRKIAALRGRPKDQKALLARLATLQSDELGRPDLAREAHRRALEIDPQCRTSLFWLARDARAAGHAATELALLDQLAKMPEDPLDPQGLAEIQARLAELYWAAGNDVEGERAARRVLTIAPHHPGALDVLDAIYSHTGRDAELEGVLSRRAEGELGLEGVLALNYRRAEVIERLGHLDRAAAVYEQIVQLRPSAAAAWERLAALYRHAENWLELLRVLERIAERRAADGEPAEAAEMLVEMAELAVEKLRDRTLTERYCNRARELDPQSPLVLRTVALYAEERGDFIAALRAWGSLGTEMQRRGDAAAELVAVRHAAELAWQRLQHARLAQELYRRLLDLDPSATDAASVLVELERPRGDTAGLLDALERQLEALRRSVGPPTTEAQVGIEIARILRAAGDARGSAERLRQALAVETGATDRAPEWRLLGELELELGDPGQAVRALLRAVELDPSPATWSLLGAAYHADGDEAHGAEAAARAAAGGAPLSSAERAEQCEAVGDHAGAFEAWSQALGEQPQVELARRLVWAASRAGRGVEAARRIEAVLDSSEAAPLIAEVLLGPGGDREKAMAWVERARRVGRDLPTWALGLQAPVAASAKSERELEAMAARAEPREAFRALTELLERQPLDRIGKITELHEWLGHLAVQLDDASNAREHYEAALSEEPERIGVLRPLAALYARLGEWQRCAEVNGRLAYLAEDPAERAQYTFDQAEIYQNQLDDLDRAHAGYLKAYDLSPSHLPTLRRLVSLYLSEGDFAALRDVVDELEAQPASLEECAAAAGIGLALAGDLERARRYLAGLTSSAVAAALAAVPLQDPVQFDPALEAATAALSPQELIDSLEKRLEKAPADRAARCAVARLAERHRDGARFRVHGAVLAWVAVGAEWDPRDPLVQHLRDWPAKPLVVELSSVVHPSAMGPLVEALAALGPRVLGLSPSQPGAVPEPAWAARLQAISDALGGPAFTVWVSRDLTELARMEATAPPRLLVRRELLEDPGRLHFAAARALHLLRAGAVLAAGRSNEDLLALLAAATALFSGTRAEPFAQAWLAELRAVPLRRESIKSAQLPAAEAALRAACDPEVLAGLPQCLAAAELSADRVAYAATGDLGAGLRLLMPGGDAARRAAALRDDLAISDLVGFAMSLLPP